MTPPNAMKRSRSLITVIVSALGALLTCLPAAEADEARDPRISRATIAQSDRYLALPVIEQTRQGFIVGIFSSSRSHAKSTRPRILIGSQNGLLWINLPLYIGSRGRKINPVVFSIFDRVFAEGETVILKDVRISKAGSEVVISRPRLPVDIRFSYDGWGPVSQQERLWLRAGIRTPRNDSKPRRRAAVLLQSQDRGESWNVRSIIAQEKSLDFTEAAVMRWSSGALIAITRAGQPKPLRGPRKRPLYRTVSDDNGLTWQPSVQLAASQVNGTQPALLRLNDGRAMLCAGDRSGESGLDEAGNKTAAADPTGIICHFSKEGDDGVWSKGVTVDWSFSTDCGQPSMTLLKNGDVLVVYYIRPSASRNPVLRRAVISIDD